MNIRTMIRTALRRRFSQDRNTEQALGLPEPGSRQWPRENPADVNLGEIAHWILVEEALAKGVDARTEAFWQTYIQESLTCEFRPPAGWEIFRARVMPLDQQYAGEPLPCREMGSSAFAACSSWPAEP